MPTPKPPTPPSPEQGELFVTTIPENGAVGEVTAVPEGGVFPSDIVVGEGQVTMAAHEAASRRAAEITRHRRAAQLGKHTIKDGESPKPGDAMHGPDGPAPVTWSNLGAATVVHHEDLARRVREAAERPALFPDATQVIQDVADARDIKRALDNAREHRQTPDPWPRLDTLSKRLQVIVDQAIGAKFIPATKHEITTGLPTVEHPGRPGAIHGEFMATHDRQAGLVRSKGYGPRVAAWEAKRAVISRVYEMTDSLADAYGSFQLLSLLQKAVDDVHGLPTLGVREVFEGNERALGALRVLARDSLILQLKDQKLTEDALGFKSMTAREVRTYKRPELPVLANNTPKAKKEFAVQRAAIEQAVKLGTGAYSEEKLLQRDKTLYSPFIPTEDGDEKLEAYVDTFIDSLTIGQLRRTGMAGKLADLQQNRYWHWRGCIADIRGVEYRKVTGPILDKYPTGLTAA